MVVELTKGPPTRKSYRRASFEARSMRRRRGAWDSVINSGIPSTGNAPSSLIPETTEEARHRTTECSAVVALCTIGCRTSARRYATSRAAASVTKCRRSLVSDAAISAAVGRPNCLDAESSRQVEHLVLANVVALVSAATRRSSPDRVERAAFSIRCVYRASEKS